MTHGAHFTHVVDRTLNALAEVLGADGAALMLIDDHDRPRAVGGTDADGRRLELAQERSGSGPSIESLARDEDVLINDLYAERPSGFPGVAAQTYGVRAVLSVPLRADDRVIGSLDFYDRVSHEWQPAEVRAGGRLAELMVMVLKALAHKSPFSGQS
ncbi:GAF domain-containing protein [Planomonospora sp. ID67723]|uniref:GAF domain-containing protein n=1 Tax=Planomonospora sp. ID67723 TaxID=2738134 RepID=UPI0018C3EE73|nr:GAF domain-containing protein [Planomonospora sp. ID67723]MBG0826556.1 GAF domain-containing protein [Planomonospora sp. ID67723]